MNEFRESPCIQIDVHMQLFKLLVTRFEILNNSQYTYSSRQTCIERIHYLTADTLYNIVFRKMEVGQLIT